MADQVCRPPDAHVFTPLCPGWEPDVDTPCDCNAIGHGAYQRLLAQRALGQAPTDTRHRWDVARVACRCMGCGDRIDAGAPIRLMTQLNRPYCEACACQELGESAPASVPAHRLTDALRPPRDLDAPRAPLGVVWPAGRSQPTVTRADLRPLAHTPLDWRLRQAEGQEGR